MVLERARDTTVRRLAFDVLDGLPCLVCYAQLAHISNFAADGLPFHKYLDI